LPAGEIGRRIRRIRQAKGETLADIANKVGCSVALLSQIETGKVAPSIKTLIAIAMALHVPVGAIFEAGTGDDEPLILRADKGKGLEGPPECICQHLGTLRLGSDNMDIFRVRLPKGARSSEEPMAHPGQDSAFVISGKMRMWIGQKSYELGEGDFISYCGDLPHWCENIGEGDLDTLWFVSPPIVKGRSVLKIV